MVKVKVIISMKLIIFKMAIVFYRLSYWHFFLHVSTSPSYLSHKETSRSLVAGQGHQ